MIYWKRYLMRNLEERHWNRSWRQERVEVQVLKILGWVLERNFLDGEPTLKIHTERGMHDAWGLNLHLSHR